MKLETYLTAHSLTPSSFAKRAGVPASTITRILKGERRPGGDVLPKISKASDGEVTSNDFYPPTPDTSEGAAA